MVRIGGPPPAGLKSGSAPSRSGSTQNMAANVKVVVRVRPPSERELEANNRIVVDVVDEQMLVFDPKEEPAQFFYQGVQQRNKNYLKRANKDLSFAFDHVCGHEATNQYVFEETTKEILASLMEGYNCSVFVYGATGAGKTFTMIGTQENPGITYLTMEHLFLSIYSFENDREFDIGVSYIEVYNENVYDLLNSKKVPLQLREDSYGVTVFGMTINKIKTAQELLDMLANGNKNRTQHPTDANAESSRSHAIFQVYINMKNKVSGKVRTVKLSMIDLAGSERASATGCTGERFKEGANINRSLLSLGNCINKLADGSNYIPYRDSKLTRILKDSLGGNCKTVMIANISPSSLCYEDTYNTLKYAARANKIQLSIKKNIVDTNMKTSEYVKANEELKKTVKELKAQLAAAVPVVVREEDPVKVKANQEWRQKLKEAAKAHANVESHLLSLMSRQRVLALRHRLKTRAFSHIVELAHRSSMEGMDQMCTEDIPRHERATDHYLKKSVGLDAKIDAAWSKWKTSKDQLQQLCTQAISEIKELEDYVNNIQMEAKIRQLEARDNLRQKLVLIEHAEINAFSNYMSDMPSMLKKLYLTLKGYDKATPDLTNEYLEIMKKAKSSKGISWSDNMEDSANDAHFKFIANLDLDKLTTIPDFPSSKTVEQELNTTIEINTDSDQLTDIENREPIQRKRKGTPIKLPNNETIIIDDSLDQLDVTRNLSAKKIKSEFDISKDIENIEGINPLDLNSTFVLAGKMEAVKKNAENTLSVQPQKKGLVDRTNTMQRSTVIIPNARAKVVKPVVSKVMPFRRPATAPATSSNSRTGFGSTVTRDGRPLQQNNVQVRGRERPQTHPYSRPTSASARR